MKMRSFFFLFLFFFSQISIAQFRAGFHIGLGFAGTGKSETRTTDQRIGFSSNIGFTCEQQLWKTTFLQSGLAYSGRSAGEIGIDNEGPHWEVSQIYIPLALKFDGKTKGKARPFFRIGGSAGAIQKKIYYSDINFGDREAVDFKKIEYNALIGFGINIQNKNNHLIYWEIHYKRGINDITDNNDKHDLSLNSTDIIHFGILFGAPKK